MRSYLRIVSKQKVVMSSKAEQMLRDYYVASRINRPSNFKIFFIFILSFIETLFKDALTQKAFEVLKTMAEAHAKLCLREIVMR